MGGTVCLQGDYGVIEVVDAGLEVCRYGSIAGDDVRGGGSEGVFAPISRPMGERAPGLGRCD